MESEKQIDKFDSSGFSVNAENTEVYRVIGIRQEQAPGSFTGYGLYYPVLKSGDSSGIVVNEERGFDPGLSFRNIPTQLLFEHGIDATREDKVSQIVDLINKKYKASSLNEDDVIARYSSDFISALKNIGYTDLDFDVITPKGDESLKIMNEEAYLRLGEKYDKKARKILLNQLGVARFGDTTPRMTSAAHVIAGNRPKLERNNMILYNVYALHAMDFDQAVRYLSTNSLFLGESMDDVKKALVSKYSKIKYLAGNDEDGDDVDRFRFFLNAISKEMEERELGIAEEIKGMRDTGI